MLIIRNMKFVKGAKVGPKIFYGPHSKAMRLSVNQAAQLNADGCGDATGAGHSGEVFFERRGCGWGWGNGFGNGHNHTLGFDWGFGSSCGIGNDRGHGVGYADT